MPSSYKSSDELQEEAFSVVLPTGAHPRFVNPASGDYHPEFLERVCFLVLHDFPDASVELRTIESVGTFSLAVGIAAGRPVTDDKASKDPGPWSQLGRQFRATARSLSEEVDAPRVSESIALALAIADTVEREPETTRIVVEARHTMAVRNASRAGAGFAAQPDRYYLFALRLGEKEVHVVGMNSKAASLFHHVFPLGHWHF